MAIVSMKSLLESGVHFGHRTNKWHPAMKPYIFTERNNIHIIDLQQTVKAIEECYALVRDVVAEGGTMLFVGTKRQAQDTIEVEATRCGMPYVINRWLGGTLTNWRTIRERITELERLERMRDAGEFELFTKKEALNFTRKIERLEMLLGGIRSMTGLPELLFVVDVRREETAIHEANLLNIPVIAMVDTNCDPRNVDYIIPSNDDAIRAIKLLVGKMADAVLEGKAMRKEEEELAEAMILEMPSLEEEELSDEELLGEATLAKISATAERVTAESAIEEAEELIGEQIEAVEIAEEVVADEVVAAVEAEEIIAEEIEAVETAEETIDGEIELVEEAKEIIAEEILEGEKPIEEIAEEIEAVEVAEEEIDEQIEAVEVAKEIIAEEIEEVIGAEGQIAEDIEAVDEAKEIIAEEIEITEAAEEEISGEGKNSTAEEEEQS